METKNSVMCIDGNSPLAAGQPKYPRGHCAQYCAGCKSGQQGSLGLAIRRGELPGDKSSGTEHNPRCGRRDRSSDMTREDVRRDDCNDQDKHCTLEPKWTMSDLRESISQFLPAG